MTDIDIKNNLEVWGNTEVEIMGDDVWFVNGEDLEGKISKSDVSLDESSMESAVYYSCCGAELDMDIRICSKCMEHC